MLRIALAITVVMVTLSVAGLVGAGSLLSDSPRDNACAPYQVATILAVGFAIAGLLMMR